MEKPRDWNWNPAPIGWCETSFAGVLAESSFAFGYSTFLLLLSLSFLALTCSIRAPWRLKIDASIAYAHLISASRAFRFRSCSSAGFVLLWWWVHPFILYIDLSVAFFFLRIYRACSRNIDPFFLSLSAKYDDVLYAVCTFCSFGSILFWDYTSFDLLWTFLSVVAFNLHVLDAGFNFRFVLVTAYCSSVVLFRFLQDVLEEKETQEIIYFTNSPCPGR